MANRKATRRKNTNHGNRSDGNKRIRRRITQQAETEECLGCGARMNSGFCQCDQ